MRHRTSPQTAQINAEVQARRAAAMRAVEDKKHDREAAEAQALLEREFGAVLLDETG